MNPFAHQRRMCLFVVPWHERLRRALRRYSFGWF